MNDNIDLTDLYGNNLLDDDAVYFLTCAFHPNKPVKCDQFTKTYPVINIGVSGSFDNLFAYIFNETGKQVDTHDPYSIASGLDAISHHWKVVTYDDSDGLTTVKTSQQENRDNSLDDLAYLLSDYCRIGC